MSSRWPDVWRRLLAIGPIGVTLIALIAPATPVAAKVGIAAVLIVALASPAQGLLLAAGLAPLGSLFGTVFDLGPFRLTEAIILSFISGWLMPGAPPPGDRPRLPRDARIAAWLFATLVAGSIAALGLLVLRTPGELGQVFNGLAWSYDSRSPITWVWSRARSSSRAWRCLRPRWSFLAAGRRSPLNCRLSSASRPSARRCRAHCCGLASAPTRCSRGTRLSATGFPRMRPTSTRPGRTSRSSCA